MIGVTGIVTPEDQGDEKEDLGGNEDGQAGNVKRAEYLEKRSPECNGKYSAYTRKQHENKEALAFPFLAVVDLTCSPEKKGKGIRHCGTLFEWMG